MALQLPAHPLIEGFVDHDTSWVDHYREITVSILNRWHAWLTAGHHDLVAADARLVGKYLRQRQQGTTGLLDAYARPLGPIAGITAHKEWQRLGKFYEWLNAEGELPMATRKIGDLTVLVEPPRKGPLANVASPSMTEPDPDRVGHITNGDYATLMASFDRRRTIDCRNAAMCSLMFWSGVRRAEVVGAELGDYDEHRGVLKVLGKGRNGGKWRTVFLLEETRTLLNRYLRRRGDDDYRALFLSQTPDDGALADGRMRPDAVAGMLDRRCAKLGIHVSAHQFRRSSTANDLRRGVPESAIAAQKGWSPSSAKLMIPRYTTSQREELTEQAYRASDPTGRRRAGRRLKAV